MKEKIAAYLEEIQSFQAKTTDEIEAFRIKFLGSKGILKSLFADFKNLWKEIGLTK